MADPTYLIDRQVMKDAITRAGANPAEIVTIAIDSLEAASNNEIQYVDASNPAMSLLETSAVIASSAIDQHVAALRQVYPILAQTPEDLYHHMSYRDYLDRFASPSTDSFSIFFPQDEFMKRAVRPPGATYIMMTIPRDSAIRVNDYVTFTLQYPIDIKYYDTQQLEVSYNATIPSPISQLTTNMLQTELINMPTGQGKWIGFSVDLPQVRATQVIDNVQMGKYYVGNYVFTDQYYMARAWYRNEANGPWIEMATTYAPTTYDVSTPTLQLKVIDNVLVASLPIIYQNSGLVYGELRVDIYTCKGNEVINLKDYDVSAFVINMQPLDGQRDNNVYTVAAQGISYAIRSTSIMSGGKNALTFDQLRERVLNNNVGPQEIPITNINYKSVAENQGFDLVANVDVVTNRIFLATRSLPKPSNTRLITSATIGVSTYTTSDPGSLDHDWVRIHGTRTTFLSKNLYKSSNGVVNLLPKQEVLDIQEMEPMAKLRAVNGSQLVYTPFYYVLDTSKLELVVRSYHLDKPEASGLNFVAQNPTLQLVVNTGSYRLEKVDNGYIFQIQTKSGNFYKQLQDTEVFVQLAAKLPGSDRYAYWLGTQVGRTDDEERIFEFRLETDYDITDEDFIALTNGKIDATSVAPAEIPLSSTFQIFHVTTSLTGLYKPSPMDDLIGRFQLPSPVGAMTQESIRLKLGAALPRLWNRGRTLPDSEIYERYAADIPMVYEADVFGVPAISIVDGEVQYNVIAKKGDVVLNEDGTPKILHHANSVVYENGKPLISAHRVGECEFDLMMVEGQYYFVDDDAYVAYRDEFVEIIVDWVTQDIPIIQGYALEKTNVYFYPKNQLSTTTVLVDDLVEEIIPSAQSFTLNLHVPNEIYRNADQRTRIRDLTIRYLDQWISSLELSVSAAVAALTDLYGDDVDAVTLSPLGGEADIQYAIISKEQTRMSLRRELAVQQDGTFIINEAVTVNFLKSSPTPISAT